MGPEQLAESYVLVYADEDGIMTAKTCANMQQVASTVAKQRLTRYDYIMVQGKLLWSGRVNRQGDMPIRPPASIIGLRNDDEDDVEEDSDLDGAPYEDNEFHDAEYRNRQDVIREILKIKEEFNG